MYVGEILKTLDRVSTGIPGLDDLIGGGFIPGRVYLISGPPGSGKTTIGIQFLIEGAKNDEKGLYISLVDDPKIIIQDMTKYDFNILTYTKARKVVFYDIGYNLLRLTQKLTWRELFSKMKEAIQAEKPKRIVIDSFTSMEQLVADPENKRRELGNFIRALEEMGITTLIISEMMSSDMYTDEYYLVSGVIVLHHFMRNYTMIRALQILKMRGTPHDSNMKRVKFSREGIRIYNEAPF
ncbi:recombinase [Thermococci archaeon]|nr:MAG: recombinase [Thermococci archaeon]